MRLVLAGRRCPWSRKRTRFTSARANFSCRELVICAHAILTTRNPRLKDAPLAKSLNKENSDAPARTLCSRALGRPGQAVNGPWTIPNHAIVDFTRPGLHFAMAVPPNLLKCCQSAGCPLAHDPAERIGFLFREGADPAASEPDLAWWSTALRHVAECSWRDGGSAVTPLSAVASLLTLHGFAPSVEVVGAAVLAVSGEEDGCAAAVGSVTPTPLALLPPGDGEWPE
jgi:hypothetical protein